MPMRRLAIPLMIAAVAVGGVVGTARGEDAGNDAAMAVDAALAETRQRARRGEVDGETTLGCAQEMGQEMSRCDGTVTRGAHQTATVTVTFANGFARRLFFRQGRFSHASATMSGTGRRDLEAWLADGVHHIRVDDQRFDVPAAFVAAP